MRFVAVLLLITVAGCSFDDVYDAELRDAAFDQPDTAAGQLPTDLPGADAGGAARSPNATTGSDPAGGGSSPTSAQADAGTGSSAFATLDAATSRPASSPEVTPATTVDGGQPATRCASGAYQGTFAAVSMSLLRRATIAGTITLELTPISGEDRLTVSGQIEGVSQIDGLIPESVRETAKVSAILNCATHQLEDGQLTSTSGTTEFIVGMLDGTYSDTPPSLGGNLSSGDLLLGTSGQWSATSQAQ